MNQALIIWLISDGKPGHENQSLGLVAAVSRVRPCEVHQISLAESCGWLGRMRIALDRAKSLPNPDMIVAAGHATHLSLLRLSKKYEALSVVLMRPSLPLSWFDHVICPDHDFPNGCGRSNVILTKGALNRVVPAESKRSGKLVLVGGPSKIHAWDGEALIAVLADVMVGGGWSLTDSRRTPEGFMDQVRSRFPEVELFSHEETASDWLPEKLNRAEEVWVTEDSVSMVYEALTSGARVGLLPMPRLKNDARVLVGVDRLMQDGFIMSYAAWKKQGALVPSVEPLCEANRCAALLLQSV